MNTSFKRGYCAILALMVMTACDSGRSVPADTTIAYAKQADFGSSLDPTGIVSATIVDPRTSERLKSFPVPSDFYTGSYAINGVLYAGPKSIPLPCAADHGSYMVGIVLSVRLRRVFCIAAADGPGRLLSENIDTGKIRVETAVKLMNVGTHNLAVDEKERAYGLVIDQACSRIPGPEGYPLRVVRVELKTGIVSRLSCSGSVILSKKGLIETKRDRGSWSFRRAGYGWEDGEPQGAIGDRVWFIRNGCLRDQIDAKCVSRGVVFAAIFENDRVQ